MVCLSRLLKRAPKQAELLRFLLREGDICKKRLQSLNISRTTLNNLIAKGLVRARQKVLTHEIIPAVNCQLGGTGRNSTQQSTFNPKQRAAKRYKPD